MKILIVDDNPTNLIIIREVLKKENYHQIISVSSAQDMFLELGIGRRQPMQVSCKSPDTQIDLILLDMMMPEMDGIEACRVVQQHDSLRDIPIIMVTAVGDSRKLAEALDAGAVDYVTKPINKVELMARIRLALRLKQEKDWHKERDQRIQEELKLAALVQNAVLSAPLAEPNFSVDALYKPTYELAGDLYAWFPLGGGRYGIILLDMMGHGISSSLFCMFIASVLKDTVSTYITPEKVIRELNRRFSQLHIDNQLMQYYFTAIYMVVDTVERRIDYVNAGHPPGLFYHSDGRVEQLGTVCPPVGLFDQIEVTPQSLPYTGDSHIVLYTDGLVEALEGDRDDQLAYLAEQFRGGHHMDKDRLAEQFFSDNLVQKREDDKCLVWVSLGE